MRNPFRTEAEAFRFVWLDDRLLRADRRSARGSTRGSASPCSSAGRRSSVLVGALPRAGASARFRRRRRRTRPASTAMLVIANETVGRPRAAQRAQAARRGVRGQVLVVCPALNTPLRHWVSDEDEARVAAQDRLEASLAAMQEAGIEARGEIGDGDPLLAIEDAIRTFAPDELVISTHPEGRSNWLERGIVTRRRERFALPVTHVVVDLEAERGDRQSTAESGARRRRSCGVPAHSCGVDADVGRVLRRMRALRRTGMSSGVRARDELAACRCRRRSPSRSRRTRSGPRTTSRIVDSSKPCFLSIDERVVEVRADRRPSSPRRRACGSCPHVLLKSTLPLTGSPLDALGMWPTAPHPAATRTATARRLRNAASRMLVRRRVEVRERPRPRRGSGRSRTRGRDR